MYCINCGVKLSDTEQKCPLCGTSVYHPEIKQKETAPLYPKDRMPKRESIRKILSGAIIFLFLIPVIVCFFADFRMNGNLEWFGYVLGALILTYIMIPLPLWFQKPNPVIFVPCGFLATALYLLYINQNTGGKWFWGFALPVVGGMGIIVCTVVTLLRYLQRGKLYILGGLFIALGVFMCITEFFMSKTFALRFIGWSIYPLIAFVLLGCMLIYLAINRFAREVIEKKVFF